MPHNTNIKILISCHKEITYPKSNIFLPVHVGAANAKRALAGIQPDNEGENISDRNFTYCELTAQYWAWKNLEADYYGQCHYRRYFYFGSEPYKANDHEQIEVEFLSQKSLSKYRLDDETLIRREVEKYDLVTAPRWSVKGVPTPDGSKNTIRDHMVAYGLVTDSDIDTLLDITKRLQPDYAIELESYLNGSEYLGYNCFIMKKALFNRLCEFEFPILKEFDSNYSYEGLTTTHKRICGYFGEILFSVFVSHVEKESDISIGHAPLVFFEDTSPCFKVDSFAVETSDNLVNVVWRYEDVSAAPLSICVNSLIRSLELSRSYKLTIVHNVGFSPKELESLIDDVPSNLSLSFATFPVMDCVPVEDELTDEETNLLLPFLLAKSTYSSLGAHAPRIVWVDGLVVFEKDPWEIVSSGNVFPFSAMNGIAVERELNKPCVKKDFSESALGFSRCFDSSLMTMDCSASIWNNVTNLYRESESYFGFKLAAILERSRLDFREHKAKQGTMRDQYHVPLEARVVLNDLMHKLEASTLSFDKAFPVLDERETLAWASETEAKKWSSVRSAAAYSYAAESSPLTNPSCSFSFKFWAIARMSTAYEILLIFLTDRELPQPRRIRDIILPPESLRRRALRKIARAVRG